MLDFSKRRRTGDPGTDKQQKRNGEWVTVEGCFIIWRVCCFW